MAVAYQQPYAWLRYLPQPTSAPAPTLPALDAPRTFTAPEVQRHTAGGCGCGSSHGGGGVTVATEEQAPAGTTRPAFLQSAMLDTPKTFQPEPTLNSATDFLKQINWSADWWKFAAGALAYKLLAK